MLSKGPMEMSMRDCTAKVYVLPDQRNTSKCDMKRIKTYSDTIHVRMYR